MITNEWIDPTIKDKLNIQNIVALYQVSKVFNLPSLRESTFSFIQRCFTMVVETKNFLELEYNFVSDILVSSGLLITTEVEVFNAANEWLGHDIKERSEFAEDLLIKVRLPLLPDHTLRHLLNSSSPITNNIDNRAIVKNILQEKYNFPTKSRVYYTNRYCNHSKFNILVCKGQIVCDFEVPPRNVTQFHANNFKNVSVLPLILARSYCEEVCLKGIIYLFGGHDNNNGNLNLSVEKYSAETEIRNKVINDKLEGYSYSACEFMNFIFIIGGHYYRYDTWNDTNSCLRFNTKNNN